MNYDFFPDNVTYGHPNLPVSNPSGTQATKQPQPQTQQTQQKPQQPQQSQQQGFLSNIMNLLNSTSLTLLSRAIALAIGFSFKDLIASGVSNVLQPFCIMLLSSSVYLNNYFNLTSLVGQPNSTFNFSSFISSVVSFIFTIITIYYINYLITRV